MGCLNEAEKFSLFFDLHIAGRGKKKRIRIFSEGINTKGKYKPPSVAFELVMSVPSLRNIAKPDPT